MQHERVLRIKSGRLRGRCSPRMNAATNGNGPVRLRDLGFGPGSIAITAALAALVPAGAAFALSAPWQTALAAAAAGATTLLIAAHFAMRRLQSQLLAPLHDAARAMENLRATGQAQRLEERGAALLQPLLRRFNLALLAVEQRDQASKASLMTVEAAFDRVHAVLQSLRECVLVVDPRGRVVLLNRSARQLLGAETRTEGCELLPLLSGDLQQAVREGIERIEQRGLTEVRAADLSYQGRIYDLTIVQVQSNRPDQDFGQVVVLADVTRNHEINRLKDELLSSISHELRTPLTNMCSSSEILTSLTAADEEAWREFATMLHGESHRLKALVDDVMEFSQLETQKVQWQVIEADANPIAERAVSLLRPKADAKGITLELATAGDATVSVDPGRLTEALCRLLDNAIKFTPENGRVRVATSVHDGLVEFAIADSGVGIAESDRQRIFERFTQIGDVMTGKPAGTGLGLSIVQRIVDAFGGQVWCEDSPLGGAQFRFVLPQTVTR